MKNEGITRNSFEGGLNTDTDKSKLEPVFYTDLHNLESVTDGKFLSLTNIRGTTNVREIIDLSNTEVLGVFANTYNIVGSVRKCLTIFTATTGGNFIIRCYDVENYNLYSLFSEPIAIDYLTEDRVIDAVGFAENGIEQIIFTDDYNEVRILTCDIADPFSLPNNSASDISMQRRGANGKIALDSILTGGALLSGSYQFAYRMVDPVAKKFTKWSSLTLPVHVYSAANAIPFPFSDYGLPTSFKIRIDITPTTEELDNFDYFQLAVVENVYVTGAETVVDGENQTFVASLLPITLNTTYLSGGVLQNFDYKTNTKVGVVPIEEIVVDLAAIKNAKTLNIKQNRLTLGNAVYHNLEMNNGTPQASGSIVTRTSGVGDLFSSHEESIYRGYFRDEVYRFGIVYKDKFGNRSPVQVLNLNSITGNIITGGVPDVHFPSRSTSNAWTLFDTNSGPSRLRSLGLQLTNIHNHPTWAVGFEIVRAKRKKKILSQTPVVPMMYVEGIGALDKYPTQAVTVVSGSGDANYPNSQPQTSSKVYMPKNLFWPEARIIKRVTVDAGIGGVTTLKKGESIVTRSTAANAISLATIFPQNFMYSDGTFTLTGSEKLQVIDYCTLRLNIAGYGTGLIGNNVNTQVKGTFYALDKGDYYFDPSWTAKAISEEVPIKGFLSFENLSEGSALNGKKIMDYSSLSTEGVDYGFEPRIQKSVVIDAPGQGTPLNHEFLGFRVKTFANAGTTNAGSGVPVFSSNPPFVYENSNTITNKYSTDYTGFVNNGAYVQALKIANIVNDYQDDRYGDVDAQHEFISTGSSYSFTTGELVSVQAGNTVNVTVDVWGGDCFVAPHIFKLSDGAYSVVNQKKSNTPPAPDSSNNLIRDWGKYFINTSGAAICLPVGLESVAQFIMVVLESEYNGAIMAQDVLVDSGTSLNGMAVLTPFGESESLRSPLTYRHNLNLAKQNDEKVYFTRPSFNFERSDFPARLLYSDQKIYNTDEVGFDVFRVLNFLDLEEKNGEVTRLVIEADNLYAVQEKGIVGLPVGETQLSTTDAGQLSVGTSDFFGRPIVIDEKKGGQHLRAIVETGDGIYIVDANNKAVYFLAGNVLNNISELNNETLFRDKLNTTPTERNLIGMYDPVRKEFWISDTNYTHRFNEKKKQWVGNYEFPTGSLRGGVFTALNIYLIGQVVDLFSVYTMYTGNANTLFGTVVTPRVTIVVNPDDPITKKFTNQAYISTERLDTVDFTVERETELTDQSIIGTVLDTVNIRNGGNYRLKIPRAAGNERLRGQRMITTIKWKTTGIYNSLSAVFTKYLLESRVPF